MGLIVTKNSNKSKRKTIVLNCQFLISIYIRLMNKSHILNEFLKSLKFQLSNEQEFAINEITNFYFNTHKSCFILSGYAGTGKTSIISNLVSTLSKLKLKTKLLAPTGRAAKVISSYSKQKAFTIHKVIYRRNKKFGENISLNLTPNLHKNTLFIIDEASMIGEYTLTKNNVSERNLLEDLFEYVYSGENCQLILVGDVGQLPPVGSDFSPALNVDYLSQLFPSIEFKSSKLTKVQRQEENSLILDLATSIRNQKNQFIYPNLILDERKDVQKIEGNELQEKIEEAINRYGEEETIIITRSNKWANKYNQHYRSRILWYEEELSNNDLLLNVKNNYYWIDEQSEAGFIANGEILKIERIIKEIFIYNTRFVKAIVSLIDYPEIGDFEVLLLPETLTHEGANLPRERIKELFFEIEKDFVSERNKQKRYESILKSPYFNALQVKYAYALTCHKSQGGQWDCVFVDPGFLNDEDVNPEFYRWLYTAFTRAKKQLYLVNFKEDYFK